MPGMRLRVMTLNLWNINDWNARMPIIRDLILQQHVDVIGFQEIRVINVRFSL